MREVKIRRVVSAATAHLSLSKNNLLQKTQAPVEVLQNRVRNLKHEDRGTVQLEWRTGVELNGAGGQPFLSLVKDMFGRKQDLKPKIRV